MIKIKNRFEREAFLKSFFIYFISMLVLISIIFVFQIKTVYEREKNSLFLDMKNFSYSFKGNKYNLSLVEGLKRENSYELKENKDELYIYVPIPKSKNEFLKIAYPKKKFYLDFFEKITPIIIFYIFLIAAIAMLAVIFSLYAISPLRKAYRLLDEGLKDIIHDVNTPLASAKVNLAILKSKYKKDEDIDRLDLSINQLINLQENLKYLNEEKRKYSDEPINIKDLIEEKVEFLSKLYTDKKVDMQIESIWIKTDKKLMDRVILNLLSNAFKHSTERGEIRVYTKGNSLIIENTAKPIKNIQRITERYYKETQRGLGLGLSIVESICREFNCKLDIDYKNGRFFVKLTFPRQSLLQTGEQN